MCNIIFQHFPLLFILGTPSTFIHILAAHPAIFSNSTHPSNSLQFSSLETFYFYPTFTIYNRIHLYNNSTWIHPAYLRKMSSWISHTWHPSMIHQAWFISVAFRTQFLSASFPDILSAPHCTKRTIYYVTYAANHAHPAHCS